MVEMKLGYLSHLAKLGATNVHPRGREATEWLLSALELKPGAGHSQRVLEVGCGTGETMLRVACRYGARVDGVDVLPEMLRAARMRLAVAGVGKRVRLYRIAPRAALPFRDETHDRAYTESVLGFQDAGSAKGMLSEVYRVLKPGGLFVANEAIWKDGVQNEVAARINRAEVEDFGLGQASEQAWALEDWLQLMRGVGFEIVSSERLDDLGRGQVEVVSPFGVRYSLLASGVLTRLYHLKGTLHPGLLAERARYRRLLREHEADGEYIEGRLFVLRKPHV